jgi:glycosyltransferase involved in cell wall biosynthesis
VHVGGALSEQMKRMAEAETKTNRRYRWLGEVSRGEALRVLARSRLHVLSSRLEGGANALCEAIACGAPTLASRIPGSVGILGARYPGYFPVGDTRKLARLMHRAETDTAFRESLRRACEKLRPLVEPRREREAWRKLLQEFA